MSLEEATPAQKRFEDRPDAANVPARTRRDVRKRRWFTLSRRPQPPCRSQWLLPMICKAGDVTKRDVGSIKILETETRFEIAADKADAFMARIKQFGSGEKGVNITRSEGAGPSSPRRTEGGDFKPRKQFGEKREFDNRKPRSNDEKPRTDWAAKPAKAKPEGWTTEKPDKPKKTPKERKLGELHGFDKYKAKKARKPQREELSNSARSHNLKRLHLTMELFLCLPPTSPSSSGLTRGPTNLQERTANAPNSNVPMGPRVKPRMTESEDEGTRFRQNQLEYLH